MAMLAGLGEYFDTVGGVPFDTVGGVPFGRVGGDSSGRVGGLYNFFEGSHL